MNTFAARAAELAGDRPELAAAVDPLLKAREAVEQQILDLHRKVLRLARNNAQVRRFMTAPGVGPVTALCFLATIDDPARFKRSRSVGAYAGLTARRYASGEIDWTGRISKCGDKMLRSREIYSIGHQPSGLDVKLKCIDCRQPVLLGQLNDQFKVCSVFDFIIDHDFFGPILD